MNHFGMIFFITLRNNDMKPLKTFLAITASVIIGTLSTSALADGKHEGKHDSKNNGVQLAANLTPSASFTGSGSINYSLSTGKNGDRGRLYATINIPVGGSGFLADSNAAASSSFIITLNGNITCNMVIKEIDFVGSEVAQFTLAVSEQNGVYSEQVGGGCSPLAYPLLAATDTVSVASSADPGTPLLTGTLAAFLHH
jgi:hypothetical protein